MNCSVIVPIWAMNERRHEVATISARAFVEHSEGAEVILIDNASEPPLDFPVAVRFEKNRGYAGAVNEGIRMATRDYIAIGSCDVVVQEGWLPPLMGSELRGPIERGEPTNKVKYRGSFYGPLWVMPREVVDKVGMMDESLYNYADRDYAMRADKAGFKIIRVPEVVVDHVDPHGSWDDWSKDAKERERQVMMDRHEGFSGYGAWERRG